MTINPFHLFMWTFRRNESDIVKLYDSLSPIMQLSTNGNMLNFGLWDESTNTPLEAQNNLCNLIGKIANLSNGESLVDVGSGFLGPAKKWHTDYPNLQISAININFNQLKISESKSIERLNSTSRFLPFGDNVIDRIIALESAQHFKPLEDFLAESKRILKPNGVFVMAIPVVDNNASGVLDLGILSFTWSSEHYTQDSLISKINNAGFSIIDLEKIGQNVYDGLANYYIKHRIDLQEKIKTEFSSSTEKILFKSIEKMLQVSKSGLIDYLLIKCK